MRASANLVAPGSEAMHLLITVWDVLLGVDASQIEEMLEVEEAAARNLLIRPIHEELSFGTRPVTYLSPKVITLKDCRNGSAVQIDRPDHFTEVTIDSLQAVPSLIAARPGASRALWGIFVQNGDIILLLDLLKLPSHPAPSTKEARTGNSIN